jgi:putative FmdB family regulatory protein
MLESPSKVRESNVPIYEYECHGCRRRVSLLILSPSTAPVPRCPRCGSENLTRLMSRFARMKSEDQRLESMSDSADLGDLNEDDPKSVARFMKKMGQEFGDELGEDFEEAVDEAMAEPAAEDAGDSPAGDDAGDL